MGTACAPCFVTMWPRRPARSAPLSAWRTSAVPIGNLRLPSVKPPPTTRTRTPAVSASAMAAAVDAFHGNR